MSGADLIGEVPANWSVKPLRLIGRLLKGAGGSKEDVVESGVPCVRYGDLYTTHRNFIEKARTYLTEDRAQDYTPIEYGDVLFAASGETIEEIGKSAVNLLHDARCGGDVVIFRPTEPNVARFFGYAMDARPVAAQKSLAGRGTTVKHIYPDELREVVIAVPPVSEQQVIADYLDRETARLDALVAAKERVLGLLAEKRRALITRAVTRGLDPRATLRDSGIPWLGKIPVHWKTLPLKRLVVRVESGVSVNAANQPAAAGELGVLKTSAVSGGDFFPFENKCVLDAEADRVACPVCADSVIMSRMNTPKLVGESGYVDQDYTTLFLPDRLWQIGFDKRTVVTRFMALVMASSGVRGVFSEMATGTSGSMKNIGQEDALGVKVPLPPIDEQQHLVDKVARESESLARLTLATQRSVALLTERRAALIAAAVTGKINVESAA